MLQTLLRSFLEASGYVNIAERHGGLRAELSAPGGQVPFYFWPMPEAPDGNKKNWPAILAMRNIAAAREEEPTAQLRFIRDETPIREDWLSRARELGVKVQYPVQFFDGDFTFESENSLSKISELNATSRSLARNRSTGGLRVSQPFTVENSSEVGEDLFRHLEQEFSAPMRREDPETATRLHIVIGPAGAGKSVLFESLFASLYEKFIQRKVSQRDARRPFQLTPEHSSFPVEGSGRGLGFDAIFSNYLSSEFKSDTRRQAFAWRIQNGYGVLMLDGLDEVIATDEYFFAFLLDVLVGTDSEQIPKVLICLRESMLSTSTPLRDFLEQIVDDVPHNIYRLSKWDESNVLEFLELFAPDTATADRFRAIINQPHLRPLAENPFYCRYLLSLVTASPSILSIDAQDAERAKSDLVDSFIYDYLERDRDKGLIDRRISHESLISVLEMLATDNYISGYTGVSVESLVAGFDVILPQDITQQEDLYERQIANLKRLALFNKASSSGSEIGQSTPLHQPNPEQRRIHFVNDVIAEYLFSRSARDKVARQTDSDLNQLATVLSAGPALPSDGIVLNQIASALSPAQVEALVAKVAALTRMDTATIDSGVRNLLQLALLGAREDESSRDVLRRHGVSLRDQKLPGMVFADLDLTGRDFEGADLGSAVFDNCDLTGARLDARLHNTRFVGARTASTLAHAHFGDLGRFQSAIIDHQSYGRREFVNFLTDALEEASQALVPDFCPALEQLWSLVRRYKAADGTATRDWHVARTILRNGARHLNDRQPLVAELIRRNYLRHDARRDHYFIQDRAHQDFSAFAQDMAALPAGLRQVLDGICSDNHIFARD